MAIIPDQTGKNISIDTPQKKKTRKQAAILTAVVIFTAGVIYSGFFSGQSSAPSVGNTMLPAGTMPGSVNGSVNSLTSKEKQSNATLESLGKTTLDGSIFSGKQLDSLTISDKLPVVIGPKGRTDPFSPF